VLAAAFGIVDLRSRKYLPIKDKRAVPRGTGIHAAALRAWPQRLSPCAEMDSLAHGGVLLYTPFTCVCHEPSEMWLMDQTSRADLFAELEQRVLTSRDNTAQIIRDLNEVFQRAERAKRDIAAYYRERRLQRLLGNQPK
jgi:hypothetical protein